MSGSESILVTGGAGFDGATLVRRLVASGYRVRVYDNLSSGDEAHLAGVDAELVKGDIRDVDALDDALAGQDAVIHLAAAGSVVGSITDPVGNFESNVLGTFRVLDAARRAGVARTVQASTGGALIGDATPPVNEQSLPKPLSPYGASKLAGEGYAHAFAKTYGLRTVAVRFGNMYGPWCARKRGVLNVYFEALHSGTPLIIYGDQPGQEIEYPMAIVIIGGLATSTLLNLFVLPPLYQLVAGWRRSTPPAPPPRVLETVG